MHEDRTLEYTNGDKYQVIYSLKSLPASYIQLWHIVSHAWQPSMRVDLGTCLQGDTLGDLRHGKGTHTCSNGDIYKGYWRLDKRHGRGKVTLANGMQYEGDWVDDKAHG